MGNVCDRRHLYSIHDVMVSDTVDVIIDAFCVCVSVSVTVSVGLVGFSL